MLNQWHALLDVFMPLIAMLHIMEDFTDEMIDELHHYAAKFMYLYVTLTDGEGVTNYIHLLGSGHITYYLAKYRNIAKFSQQGWEALNQLLKQFYFNNTNHGGSNGNRYGQLLKGQHLKPLMRLVQRRNMWLLGLAEEFFEKGAIIEEINFPDGPFGVI